MPDDPTPARPISLEYAGPRAADAAAARGLVYVLAAYCLAQGWRVGFLYGDAVFNWIGYGYEAVGHGLSAWVLHGSSATIALAALLAVASAALAAAGRGGARRPAVLLWLLTRRRIAAALAGG